MSLKMNFSVWMLAIWLVILQVLSPFVHAHIDVGDHSDQANGIHLHSISFNPPNKALDLSHHNLTENDYAIDTHIVMIGKGLIQKLEILDATVALIAVFIFFVIKTTPPRKRLQNQLKLKPSFQCGFLSPRAPPYC